MFRDFLHRPKNIIAVILVVSVLGALIWPFISASKANLPEYVAPEPTPTPEPVYMDTVPYQSDTQPLSAIVPTEWTKVIKDGYDTFVNPIDGTSISFQISDYQPSLNMITAESISESISRSNGILGKFIKMSTSSYVSVYEVDGVDYFEYVLWDLDTAVRVYICVDASRFSAYYDDLTHILDNVVWEPDNPIPDDYSLYYNEFGSFEFGVPVDWVGGISDGIYTASSDTGANMAVSLIETADTLEGLSQVDYISVVGNTRQSFMLQSFSNAGNVMSATSTYMENGISYTMIHNILSTGTFQYEFIFTCPNEYYEQEGIKFVKAMELFRIL